MSDIKYQLTEHQQQYLKDFVNLELSEYIDEVLHGEWLIPDEMVDVDDWDAINARKSAAIEYITNNL